MRSEGRFRPVLLYLAASLDGRIANGAGSVNWLLIPNDGPEEDYGYKKFMSGIKTILMGRKTLEDVLGFGCDYPYKSLENIVFTRNPAYKNNNPKLDGVDLNIINSDIVQYVRSLKERPIPDNQEAADIYVNGGGEIVSQLVAGKLIDEIILTLHPSIQGDGPLLFPGKSSLANLKLISHKAWPSGLVQLHYKVSYSL